MEADMLRSFARDVLALPLTEADAARLTNGLAGLRRHIETIESVPLPLLGEVFLAPAIADVWLEAWPQEGHGDARQ